MLKSFRERFAGFFNKESVPPIITEHSSLVEMAIHYPNTYDFIERKYGVKIDVDDKPLSLKDFVEKYGLPPAQILFMEIQTSVRTTAVKMLNPKEAKHLMDTRPDVRLLDVREEWEVKICKLEKSQQLSPQLLDQILTEWPKHTLILMYCHFGIRSLDAAMFLADRGYTGIHILEGGIDAWSAQVAPQLPRYENAWC